MFVSLIVAVFVASLTFTPQAQASPPWESCWGQASAVFAQMGYIEEGGVISEPSLAALGAYVADAEGLSIDACVE